MLKWNAEGRKGKAEMQRKDVWLKQKDRRRLKRCKI